MLQPWGPDSEIARDVEEIEMRALAVSPQLKGEELVALWSTRR